MIITIVVAITLDIAIAIDIVIDMYIDLSIWISMDRTIKTSGHKSQVPSLSCPHLMRPGINVIPWLPS